LNFKFTMKKNILITGATGYIGKHLLKRLVEEKNKVTVLVRKTSNLSLIKDLQSQIYIHQYNSDFDSIDELFNNKKFDYVLHLASISNYDHKSENIDDMIDSNIKLGTFILEAMKKHGCKYFINTSTYWQNYQNQNYQPNCFYAATKKAFEDIIDFYCISQEIKAISLKLYDVYGYNDHRNKLLNYLFTKSSNKKTTKLTAGEQKLYMVFIDDVIDAYQLAMNLIINHDQGHAIYGIYGKEKYSLKQIIDIAQEIANKKFNIKFGARDYNQFQIMDSYGFNKLPQWDAKISLKEGIKIILNKK